MFAYCGNNPVVRVDTEGEFWNTIVGAVAGAISGCINAIVTGSDMVESVVAGAVSGAAQGAVLDIVLSSTLTCGASLAFAVVVGGIASGVTSALTQAYDRDEGFDSSNIDWTGVAIDTAWGMTAATLSYGVAKPGFPKTLEEAVFDISTSSVIATGTTISATIQKAPPSLVRDREVEKNRKNHCLKEVLGIHEETQRLNW